MENRELFELELSDGPSLRLHERLVGDIESEYPWAALDPAQHSPLAVERARLAWTQNAYNEYLAVGAMGGLLVALAQARAPIDFWSVVSRFALEEVRHVELSARIATQLGGGAPVAFSPADVVPTVDPSLPPLQRATELVVRILCVGEGLSHPILRGSMEVATNPLIRAVLRTIVAEEAPHARLGWLYLDWVASQLAPGERERLAAVARETVDHYAQLWDRMSRGPLEERHTEALGFMTPPQYVAVARAAVDAELRPRLASYGIVL